MSLPTNCREFVEERAKEDELYARVLALAKEQGLDWTQTLEHLVMSLQIERRELLDELAPFRAKGVRMIPVYSMEQLERSPLPPHLMEP